MNTLHFSFIRRFAAGAVLMAALAASTVARAQGGIGDIVYTVGTVAQDTNGQHWAYILWQSTTPALISNRVFAVYSKFGEATNPAPYVRRSVVMTQTDARVIEPLLRRGAALGDDLFKLQDDLLQIFGNLMPSNAISRADQLSAVIRGSLTDAKYYQNLMLLARNHAGINLALGMADAELIPPASTQTFEVRVYDMIQDKDIAVIGRVTVTAGSPTVLPAPGAPVIVPENSPRGDLNVKLRWSMPDPLRRLGLMQFGYNLYRMERTYALGHGWNAATPPPINVLSNLAVTSPNIVKRVNRAPLTPRKSFSFAEAANVFPPAGDTNTFFIMDDDGRGRSNYVNNGWVNGAQFFYYVTARDVLGRDGFVSQGVLATVCDRMPPMPPRNVHVVNDYKYDVGTMTSNQALRVIWKQNINTNDTTTNYWIYRWTSITQMHALSGDISNHLIGVVAHVPGATFNNYLDVGPTSPKTATDLGKTFWYTVRAGDAGACRQNLSGPGGPAWGVLRDRTGPDAGVGIIEINCLRPLTRYVRSQIFSYREAEPENFYFHLTATRLDQRFEWAQFYCVIRYTSFAGGTTINQTNDFGQIYFQGGPSASAWWTPPRSPDGGQYSVSVDIRCRAGLFNGKVSNFAIANQLELPPAGTYAQVDFEAYTINERLRADQKDRDCREHDPGGPGGSGVSGTNNIGVIIFPTPGSKEYRIYRRVDDGPLSLICDGAISNIFALYECFENAPPVNGGTICFYFQLLDEHGNPSPMVNIGCIDTAPVEPLPIPVLTKLTPTGNTNAAGMNISWFCPPYGVDRFEVRIAGSPTPPVTNVTFSSILAFTGAPPATMTYSNSNGEGTNVFYAYITPKAGPAFGNNGPQFLVPANIQIGKTYIVTVRALGKNGNAGEFSNFETFIWGETNVPSPQVPWPKRPLPSTNASFFALAFFLSPTSSAPVLRTSSFEGNGVLVGAANIPRSFVNPGRDGQPPTISAATPYNPHDALETNAAGQVIFPCALYRYQVPNANFPTVSGDVIQVSPLMEKIAYEVNIVPGKQPTTIIWDPFIAVTSVSGQTSNALYLWIRDTQPQISGARYRYVLVRLKENREIDQLIQSNEVEVP